MEYAVRIRIRDEAGSLVLSPRIVSRRVYLSIAHIPLGSRILFDLKVFFDLRVLLTDFRDPPSTQSKNIQRFISYR